MRIAMIDDEWAFLEIISLLLRKKGYDLFSFGDPQEFLEWLSDEKNKCPDLIITDLMMPYCTGSQMLEIIRSGKRCQGVPAILISSMEETQIDRRLFARFVPKSKIMMELASAIDQTAGAGDG